MALGITSHPRRLSWLAVCLLAACLAAVAVLAIGHVKRHPNPASGGTPPIPVYTPRQIRVAYGVQALLDRGIDGRGEVVVVPELGQTSTNPPVTDIRRDMALFDSTYGLPAAKLSVVTSLMPSASPFLAGTEEAEDTEIVHAIAPGATIAVVLVSQTAGASGANFTAAVVGLLRLSLSRAAVISISGSFGEHFFSPAEVARLHQALQDAHDHHVTVVAASGDSGAASDLRSGSGPIKEVSLPASDPLVLAVGGTSLDADMTTGAYYGETAWNHVDSPGDSDASGGGFSHLFARPAYQEGVAGGRATRGMPDVAADANAATGMGVVSQGSPILPAGGTSAAAPLWAGIIALADQYAGHHLGFVNAAIYRVARGPLYHEAFHDVTTGDNSVLLPTKLIAGYSATPGWDPVTGWGSPNAQVLVPLLAHEVRADDGSGP